MEVSKRAVVVGMMMLFLVTDQMVNGQMTTVCGVPVSGLMSCRDAATPPHPPPPSRACCSTMAHADLRCLCRYKSSSIAPSVGVDPKLAMQLPAKCRIPAPRSC